MQTKCYLYDKELNVTELDWNGNPTPFIELAKSTRFNYMEPLIISKTIWDILIYWNNGDNTCSAIYLLR